MQKIQFYLVPNIITVTTDRAGFSTENRKVYQRKIKLYKGIDNVLQLDVRNVEYRKEDVVGKTADVNFYDSEHKLLFTVTAAPIVAKPGQMELTVPTATLEKISPQKLTMAAKLDDNGTDRMLYIDTQFGLHGGVEVLDGYNEKLMEYDPLDPTTFDESIIFTGNSFNYEFDLNGYVSELIPFGTRINDDVIDPARSLNLEIFGNSTTPFIGDIEVQATKNLSTSFGNIWETIATITTTSSTSTAVISNPTGEYAYFKLIHPKYKTIGTGALFDVTISGSTYSAVTVIEKGQNYSVGDQLVIKGSYLGGNDGINDLTVTVNGINVNPAGAINSATITWAGVAAIATGSYSNLKSEQNNLAGTLDKVIVRN